MNTMARDHLNQGNRAIGKVREWLSRNGRFLAAGFIVVAAAISACVVLVVPGQAIVVTRLGDPIRVATAPGLAWKIPAPVENTIPVDLRLKKTSSGLRMSEPETGCAS
jgi:modulator of FtsH protease HflC